MMRKYGFWVTLAVFCAVLGYWHFARSGNENGTGGAMPAVPVTVRKTAQMDLPVYLRGLGQVQAYNTVVVKTRVDGTITAVDFKEGQEIEAGAPLFQIDPRPFSAALEQAQAAKERDTAQLREGQLDLARFAKLLTTGFQSRQSYDQQQALVAQYAASVKLDQATIDSAALNLTYSHIVAPITGRTGARNVDIGNLVQAASGTSLVTITQMKPIYVSFTLAQEDLGELRRLQLQSPLAVLAYSGDDQTLIARGRVCLIDNSVDQASGTIHLKAEFDNNSEELWPGAFISAHVLLYTLHDAVVVPSQAIQQGPDGYYVYVLKPDQTVEKRDVSLGPANGGNTAISKGLSAGETVVVDGQYRLIPGVAVKTQYPQQTASAD